MVKKIQLYGILIDLQHNFMVFVLLYTLLKLGVEDYVSEIFK